MPYRYAMSDSHGVLDVLDAALAACELADGSEAYLLGDMIPHRETCDGEADFIARSEAALARVREWCQASGGHAHALMGNHEYDLVEDVRDGRLRMDDGLFRWCRYLPLFAETEDQIFVHAGIDEEAGDLWQVGSPDVTLVAKNPITFGTFEKDIISGHVSAWELAGRPRDFAGIFWDGASHYFIDGATETTGHIPLLRYDLDARRYEFALVTAHGVGDWQPVVR